MLHRTQIILEYLGRSFPSQRAHGEMVIIPAVVCLKLFCKVLKRIETVGGIKTLVVLPVAALRLAVMPGCIGANDFMEDAVALETLLEKGWFIPVGGKTVSGLRPVIGLDALNGVWEGFYKAIHKQGRGIRALFLKSLHIAPSGILVNGSVLEETPSNYPAVNQTGRGNKLHIHLDALPGALHLFVGLGDVLGVGGMFSHDAPLFEEAVQSWDGAGITALHEFHPENGEAGIRVSPAHIGNKFNLGRSMLVGVVAKL